MMTGRLVSKEKDNRGVVLDKYKESRYHGWLVMAALSSAYNPKEEGDREDRPTDCGARPWHN